MDYREYLMMIRINFKIGFFPHHCKHCSCSQWGKVQFSFININFKCHFVVTHVKIEKYKPKYLLIAFSRLVLQVLVQNQQPMLINSSSGGGQLLLTQNNGQTYVMSPSQGLQQGQTFLVAQSPQQQGTNTKTIIILHQQGQKMGTPGQPMMVQLPRSAIQGGASGLQGLMLSQGAGGQMTVSLPGCNPIIARPMDPSNGSAQQIVKAVAAQQPNIVKAIVSTAVASSTTTSQPPPLVSSSTSATAVTTSVVTPTVATPAPQPTVTLPVSPYICEWRGCMRFVKILLSFCCSLDNIKSFDDDNCSQDLTLFLWVFKINLRINNYYLLKILCLNIFLHEF